MESDNRGLGEERAEPQVSGVLSSLPTFSLTTHLDYQFLLSPFSLLLDSSCPPRACLCVTPSYSCDTLDCVPDTCGVARILSAPGRSMGAAAAAERIPCNNGGEQITFSSPPRHSLCASPILLSFVRQVAPLMLFSRAGALRTVLLTLALSRLSCSRSRGLLHTSSRIRSSPLSTLSAPSGIARSSPALIQHILPIGWQPRPAVITADACVTYSSRGGFEKIWLDSDQVSTPDSFLISPCLFRVRRRLP